MEPVKHKKVYVAKTKLGWGLFAKTDIKKGEVVFIVKGNLVKDDYNEDYQTIPNSLIISEGVWLDPFENNSWRFINHSCAPNVGLKGKTTVVTLCNIRGGEK